MERDRMDHWRSRASEYTRAAYLAACRALRSHEGRFQEPSAEALADAARAAGRIDILDAAVCTIRQYHGAEAYSLSPALPAPGGRMARTRHYWMRQAALTRAVQEGALR